MALTITLPCARSSSPTYYTSSFQTQTSPLSPRMPRSSGCANCKRRKVRCDEAKPHCQRCIKAKLDCPGYTPPEPPQKRAGFPFKDQTQLTIAKAEGSWTSSRRSNYSQPSTSAGEGPSSTAEAPVLNLNASPTQLYSSFLDSFLPQDQDASETPYSYLIDLDSNDPSHHALQNASRALSFVRLSAASNDHNLIQHSRVAYGNSLSQLRIALTNPDGSNQDQTLATILLLGFYELHKAVQEPTVGSVNHYAGAARYIQLRGPESFRTVQSRQLLNNHRNFMLMMGLKTHTSILYENPDWLAVTRAGSQADDWSALIDIGVHIPGVLQSADALVSNANPASNAGAAKTALTRLRALKTHFNEWQARSTAAEADAWRVPLAEMPGVPAELAASAPFDAVFTARSFNHAHNFLLYNLFVANLLRAALQVQHYRVLALAADEEAEALALQAALEADYRTHLTLLVQCVPFMLRPESSTVGWLVVATALWFARHATREVGGLEGAAAWCDAVAAHAGRQNLVALPAEPWGAFPGLRPMLE